MKKTLKTLLSLLTVVAFSVSLGACGGSKTESSITQSSTSTISSSTTEKSTNEVKKVKAYTMALHSTWSQYPGMVELMKYMDSKSQDLGFKIEYDKLPEGEQGDTVIQARLAAGEAADLIAWYNQVGTYTSYDNFAEISGDWTNNFDKSVFEGAAYTNKGKIIAVPLGSINLGGIFYNKKVFEQAGVQVPNTWDELIEVSKKIKALGIDPMYLPYKDAWTTQFLSYIAGVSREAKTEGISIGELTKSVDTNKKHYTEMKTLQDSLQKEVDYIKAGYTNKSLFSDTYPQSVQAVLSGKAAMTPNATWIIGEFAKADETKFKSDIGAFSIPFDGNDTCEAFLPNALYVNAKGKDVEGAKNVAQFFASKEALNIYFKADKSIPLATGIETDLYPSGMDLYKIFQIPGRGAPSFDSAYSYNHKGNVHLELQGLFSGGKSIPGVLKYMDDFIADQAKKAKDPNFNK